MNDENSKNKRFSILEQLNMLQDPYKAHVQYRISCIQSLLIQYGSVLRDDSRLAFLWATERLNNTWSIDEVCHEIMCVQFICETTSYNELLQPFMKNMANEMRRRYKLKSWITTWRIVRQYAPDILKTISMIENNTQMPNFVPQNAFPTSG